MERSRRSPRRWAALLEGCPPGSILSQVTHKRKVGTLESDALLLLLLCVVVVCAAVVVVVVVVYCCCCCCVLLLLLLLLLLFCVAVVVVCCCVLLVLCWCCVGVVLVWLMWLMVLAESTTGQRQPHPRLLVLLEEEVPVLREVTLFISGRRE